MATRKEIEMILDKLDEVRPALLFKRTDDTNAGIGAVLRLLIESPGPVTAGKISDELHISTARVAVLIRKMVAKGLITREHRLLDARITIVKLTDLGEKTILEMRDEVYQIMEQVIDAVGIDRLSEFLEIAGEIQRVTQPHQAGAKGFCVESKK